MKTLKIKLLVIVLLSCLTATAQVKNLDKLPQSKRDSILIDIAKLTISRHSEGYYREGAIPTIKDLGIFKAKRKFDLIYNGIRMFSVSYPLNLEEKEYYRTEDAIVSVMIRADIGKAIEIRFVDGLSSWGIDEDDKKGIIPIKRKYTPLEKVKQMGRDMVRGTTTVYEYESREEMLNALPPEARARAIRNDSIKNEAKRKKAESILLERQKRMEDSLRNEKRPQI